MTNNFGVPVILFKDNQILLARRKNAYGAGMWGLPGGRLNNQETIDQCINRELLEETGVKPVEWQAIGIVKEWQKTDFFVHFVALCTKWNGEVSLREPEKSESWTWFRLNELPELILPGHNAGLEIMKNYDKKTIGLIEL